MWLFTKKGMAIRPFPLNIDMIDLYLLVLEMAHACAEHSDAALVCLLH